MPIPDRAVLLAMRARRPDPYAEAPTVLYDPVDEVAAPDPWGRDDDTAVSPSDEGVLLPDDEAPADEDTSWGTPLYAPIPVPPVTAADIPDWYRPRASAPAPAAPLPARVVRGGVAREDLVGALMVWTLSATAATIALAVAIVARVVVG